MKFAKLQLVLARDFRGGTAAGSLIEMGLGVSNCGPKPMIPDRACAACTFFVARKCTNVIDCATYFLIHIRNNGSRELFVAHGNVVRVTSIPGPVSRKLAVRRQNIVPRGVYNATSIFAASGTGAKVTDVDGNTYIDFAGGIGALNVGYSHPQVIAAVRAQAERFLHTCFHVLMYEGYVELAERLASLTPGEFPKKAILLNSGAEAVENAIKVARAYTRRPAIIAFTNSFHGRTLLALTLTGKEHPYKALFDPFVPEIYHAPFPYVYRFSGSPGPEECTNQCLRAIVEMFETHVAPERVAAVIVEPVQGEGGFVIPPRDFLPRLQELCAPYNILLIADEIQTGFWRTGSFLAVDHFGVIPDLVILGKSLAAGLPLSAVVGRQDVLDAPEVGGLGGTYGGNPLACAAALAVLRVFEKEDLVERGQHIGELLCAELWKMAEDNPLIGDVRILGSMAALELVRDQNTREPAPDETTAVLSHCHEQGLIILKAGLYSNVVRILVPLVATKEEMNSGLGILKDAIAQVCTSVAT